MALLEESFPQNLEGCGFEKQQGGACWGVGRRTGVEASNRHHLDTVIRAKAVDGRRYLEGQVF